MRYYCEDCKSFFSADSIDREFEPVDDEGGYYYNACPRCKGPAIVTASECPLCRGDMRSQDSICTNCRYNISADLNDLIGGYIAGLTKHSHAGYTAVKDIVLERIEKEWF